MFFFFSSIYKIVLIYKITLKTLNLPQVVARTSVLFIAICLHKYIKWNNEYLINICVLRMQPSFTDVRKILKYLKVMQYIKEKRYKILSPEYYPEMLSLD